MKRKEVVLGSGVGEDCCAVDLNGDLCVLSTDPITGAVNEIGSLAVHISCNDIASCGAEPVGLLVTILAPVGAGEKEIETIMTDISLTADRLNVDVLGGHTEVTDAVNRFVLSATCIGRVKKKGLVVSSGAVPGNDIIMTGHAGVEGTSILAHDREEELKKNLGSELVEKAKTFKDRISVVKAGMLAGKFGVNAMHDVTEGGILGAVWELCEASGTGAVIEKEKIPIAQETLEICRYFGINPLRLISSGSMVITCEEGDKLTELLESEGIKAQIIGKITAEPSCYLTDREGKEPIGPPAADELYKIVSGE